MLDIEAEADIAVHGNSLNKITGKVKRAKSTDWLGNKRWAFVRRANAHNVAFRVSHKNSLMLLNMLETDDCRVSRPVLETGRPKPPHHRPPLKGILRCLQI
ncbi:hypothetical protein BGI05_05190 [Snodgrassella alvi]|nr:hypothetical protein BGH97_02540 [Snodgrassella alvi]ORF09376.1 hypothetical protein BGH99_02515 [Snodgrassella alvi]ORF14707.1 hypothetical protein BGI00_01830 [Snodgrassella alvi]ORF15899.1 hypothetical protein BGI02_01960 [Snodgrassella alvi]ORF21004.1 hypothetical protein BGI05_05190 [Snodgrassella alvi]